MNNQKAEKKQLPAYLVLAIIALVAALLLAVTNAITAGPIKEHAQNAQREAFGAVLTADEYNELTIPEGSSVTQLVEAKTDGKVVGYCAAASAHGYAGPVAVTLGVDADGKITGCKVGDNNFVESAGFGARAKEAAFQEQFIGLDGVNGGTFEALSGATITSTAVLNAANDALDCINQVAGRTVEGPILAFGAKEEKPVEQMTLTGDVLTGTAKGFASDVKVELTLDDNGAVTGLTIDSSGETAGFGQRCMEEPEFAKQFIGKTAPFAAGENIDVLAGATVTSKAVVEAANNAVTAPASAASETTQPEATAVPENAKTATVNCTFFGDMSGDVIVTVTENEDGTVATLTVDASSQTPSLGGKCAEEAFISQFIGKKAPFTLNQDGIDQVSGATLTSQVVVDAINSLYPEAAAIDVIIPAEEPTAEPTAEPAAATATPENAKTATVNCTFFDGMSGDVIVTVTENEDGSIATLTVDASSQTPTFGGKCAEEAFTSQFIGKKAPFTLNQDGIDQVSGATLTSQAVVDAINSLYPAAAAIDVIAPTEEPTATPTEEPTATPTEEPTATPTEEPTATPTEEPTATPTEEPTATPTEEPTATPTQEPTATPTQEPTATPTQEPTATPTQEPTATPTQEPTATPTQEPTATPTEEPTATPTQEPTATPAAPENAKTATVNCTFFGDMSGDVIVTVTENEDGSIATLTVDASSQTPSLGGKCAEEAFTSQFIGKKAPFTLNQDGIDQISGATLTSQAVVDAINSLYPAAAAIDVITPTDVTTAVPTEEPTATPTQEPIATPTEEPTATPTQEPTATPTEEPTATPTQEPTATPTEEPTATPTQEPTATPTEEPTATPTQEPTATPTEEPTATPTEEPTATPTAEPTPVVVEEQRTLTITVPCQYYDSKSGDIIITLVVNADGTIAELTVDVSSQSPARGQKCGEKDFTDQFIGKTAPLTLSTLGVDGDIDCITGATRTCQAIVDAINELLK